MTTDISELEILVREYIAHCTDEELKEQEVWGHAPAELQKAVDHEDAERLGIAWDTMNDEVDAEDLRRYIADYWIYNVGVVTTSHMLFRQCWDRLFSTLESQGYRPTPHGLTHESEL